MSPALAGGFFTTEPPGKPAFLTLGSSFGLLLMEKGKKSFVVSYSPGSPLSLSFSPPLLLLILKQQIPFEFPQSSFMIFCDSLILTASTWQVLIQVSQETIDSYNGERNGSPLQCSCLENSLDGRAWWAAVHEVAESQT